MRRMTGWGDRSRMASTSCGGLPCCTNVQEISRTASTRASPMPIGRFCACGAIDGRQMNEWSEEPSSVAWPVASCQFSSQRMVMRSARTFSPSTSAGTTSASVTWYQYASRPAFTSGSTGFSVGCSACRGA